MPRQFTAVREGTLSFEATALVKQQIKIRLLAMSMHATFLTGTHRNDAIFRVQPGRTDSLTCQLDRTGN